MRPARFVTLCFLYSGVVLVLHHAFIYEFQVSIASVLQLGTGISILAVGLVRLRYPNEERNNPQDWGLLTYGIATLAIVLTVIFVVQVLIG